jgi:chromosomal replication initiation ATPase DnaA
MNYYQQEHNLKQEIRRLRLVITQLNISHSQEVKRLKNEILRPKCDINNIEADWTDTMRVCCQIYDVTPDQIISHYRKQHIVYARHLFCYLCRKHLKMTFLSVGNILNRDHSSIINSVNVFSGLIEYDRITNQHYQKAVELLDNYLQERIDADNLYLQDGGRDIAM